MKKLAGLLAIILISTSLSACSWWNSKDQKKRDVNLNVGVSEETEEEKSSDVNLNIEVGGDSEEEEEEEAAATSEATMEIQVGSEE